MCPVLAMVFCLEQSGHRRGAFRAEHDAVGGGDSYETARITGSRLEIRRQRSREAYADATGKAHDDAGVRSWILAVQAALLRIRNRYWILRRVCQKRDIPLDVLVIDYYHWKRCGDWRFDEEYFPAPEEKRVQKLKDAWDRDDGIHLAAGRLAQ